MARHFLFQKSTQLRLPLRKKTLPHRLPLPRILPGRPGSPPSLILLSEHGEPAVAYSLSLSLRGEQLQFSTNTLVPSVARDIGVAILTRLARGESPAEIRRWLQTRPKTELEHYLLQLLIKAPQSSCPTLADLLKLYEAQASKIGFGGVAASTRRERERGLRFLAHHAVKLQLKVVVPQDQFCDAITDRVPLDWLDESLVRNLIAEARSRGGPHYGVQLPRALAAVRATCKGSLPARMAADGNALPRCYRQVAEYCYQPTVQAGPCIIPTSAEVEQYLSTMASLIEEDSRLGVILASPLFLGLRTRQIADLTQIATSRSDNELPLCTLRFGGANPRTQSVNTYDALATWLARVLRSPRWESLTEADFTRLVRRARTRISKEMRRYPGWDSRPLDRAVAFGRVLLSTQGNSLHALAKLMEVKPDTIGASIGERTLSAEILAALSAAARQLNSRRKN